VGANPLTMDESEETLRKSKSEKASGLGLVKCGGILLELGILHLLNLCWNKSKSQQHLKGTKLCN
jgi:hypothetical protein